MFKIKIKINQKVIIHTCSEQSWGNFHIGMFLKSVIISLLCRQLYNSIYNFNVTDFPGNNYIYKNFSSLHYLVTGWLRRSRVIVEN